jgi:hypothetical protein
MTQNFIPGRREVSSEQPEKILTRFEDKRVDNVTYRQ